MPAAAAAAMAALNDAERERDLSSGDAVRPKDPARAIGDVLMGAGESGAGDPGLSVASPPPSVLPLLCGRLLLIHGCWLARPANKQAQGKAAH